ncbi:MAG: Ig-like domain-containing protein [Acidobacteria bacterium]|nr:Ig-like domain-containing protein [Acidobacteriota bacterium]
MRKFLAIVAVGVCVAFAAAKAAGQGTTRIATTANGLISSALFYHGKYIVIEHDTLTETGVTRLAGTARPVFVFWKDRAAAGKGEIRGEFWDLGRVEQGDGRFAAYDFTQLLDAATRGRWPRRDEVYVILGATLLPSSPPHAPTVRAVTLAPERYEGREVKVVGRFRGHNLYGDLPQALGKTKWDFVLQSAEGAVWVTGMRPKGKGFDLDPGARVDTGRWLEVTGVVSMIGSMPYITSSLMQAATAPAETAVEVAVPERPTLPVPEVIFSAPVDDDHGVERAAPVRLQFSRDVDPVTVPGRVKVSYASPGAAAGAPPVPPKFTVTYNDAAHAIEIRFAQPLERFQQVRVELLEGVTSLDGQTVKPWTLTFTTGG